MKRRSVSSPAPLLLLALFAALALPRPGRAATIVWSGSLDEDWVRGANWQGGNAPGSGDTAWFGNVTRQTIDLAGDRTIAGLTFAAPDDYLIADTGDVLTLAGPATFQGAGAVQFDTELALTAMGVTFSGTAGSGAVTINGEISGAGSLTFAGGSYTLTNNNNRFTGGVTINQGAVVTLAPPSGSNVDVANSSNSLLGRSSVPVAIDGGTLRLVPTGTGLIGTGTTERTFAFGPNGGVVEFAGKTNPANGEIWSFQTTAAPLAIPVVRYGTPASATNGWATGGNSLQIGDAKKNSANGLLGSGPITLELSAAGQGALVELRNTDYFTGTVTIRGVPGGSSAAPNNAFNVARVSLGNDAAYAFHWTFEHAVQVSNAPGNGTNRVLDGNLTLAANADVAFAGRPDGASGTLALGGANAATETLTIHAGAAANLDVGYRTDATTAAGVLLNMRTVIEPGGTLRFRKTVATITPGTAMQLNGDVTGKGHASADARLDVQLDVGTGAGQLTMPAATSFVVNGAGTGGLRIEGSAARLAALLTANRLQQRVLGTGGTFTVAPSGTLALSAAPLAAGNPIKLGLASSGSGGAITLGGAANDLANWAGLVIKPSSGAGATTVTLGADQAFASGAAVTTTLDVLGGMLDVGTRRLSVEGQATLIDGTITGSTGQVVAGAYEVRNGSIGARLSGDAALLKSTGGLVQLGRANDFTGPTTIAAGTLHLHVGASLGSGSVTVAGGATLIADGTIAGNLASSGLLQGAGVVLGAVALGAGGVLAPGGGPGRLSTGGLTAPAGSTVEFDLAGTTPGSGHDQLRVTGGVTLGATLSLHLLPGFVFSVGDKFTLVENDGSDPIGGAFAGLPQGASLAAGSALFQISYTGHAATGAFAGAGNDVLLMAIPEPGFFVHLASGTALLICLQRGRRRCAR